MSVYDTDRSKLLNRFENRASVLSCDLIDENHVCLGGLDCDVKVYEWGGMLICVGIITKRNRSDY